ncbi:hypothetical protein F443_16489 [Phytophthora nicotianae P1569]|uniref:Uncharacterized protein n=1 Tax=Phytophthora nicotianae P1569 TaxID=1317065 RepID=V9EE92_PHYNI|nr:hypothetical protein F443_16489 [Phytophthora nicotianae P1569]
MEVSAAQVFFQAHKDLFQYEKYVGNQDPFHIECTKSFLEQYREIDRDRRLVPATSERFSLLYPPTRRFSSVNLTVNPAPPVPEFVTLQATASVLENLNNPLHEPTRSHTFTSPPQRTSQYNQPRPGLRVSYDSSAAQYPNPDRSSVPKATPDRSALLQQRSPIRLSTESKQKNSTLPKLTDLLIDRETRAATTHKIWEETHKIQVLTGNNCVGRVNAASRNLPLSIRSRLHVSANVSVRRERLYNLLRRDYEELSK